MDCPPHGNASDVALLHGVWASCSSSLIALGVLLLFLVGERVVPVVLLYLGLHAAQSFPRLYHVGPLLAQRAPLFSLEVALVPSSLLTPQ